MPQYFASFEPFEVFDEFNGVQGTYIKSFLISDKINLNDWQATHEANISNLDTFLGRPGIHYINPENGKRDHTGATSFEKSLQLQELYRAASIISVGSEIATKKNWQVSKMVDDDVAAKIKSREIKWISPSIWPEENSVEQIEHTDGRTIDVVHDYKGLHYAFVDEPAYDDEAAIKSFCDGTTKACQLELQKFNASIDNVAPLTEHEIKTKKKKKKNSSATDANTSHKKITTSANLMTNEVEVLQKKLEESEKARKATDEEFEKLKDKEAKRAAEDEEKDKEAKKATDEDKKEKEELEAKVAKLEKVPIVEKIISSQLSAGVIASDKESETRTQLMSASLDTLNATLNTSKSFEAKIKSHSTAGLSVPYMGSISDDSSDYGSFDAKVDDVDYYQTIQEVTS